MKQRILIYDLETTSTDPDTATPRLMGFMSSEINGFMWTTDPADMATLISQHDVIVGWNNRNYDNEILRRYGANFRGKVIVDLMNIIHGSGFGSDKGRKSIIMTPDGNLLSKVVHTKKLADTTIALAGPHKIGDFDYNLFKKPFSELNKLEQMNALDYLKADIMATEYIYKYIETFFADFASGGIEIDGVFKNFLNPKQVERKFYLTSSVAALVYKVICNVCDIEEKYSDEPHRPYDGGFVSDPTQETCEGNIYCLDYNSLYPHIMIQANLYSRIGVQKLDPIKQGISQIEGVYDTETMAPVGKALQQFYKKRLEYKRVGDEKQYTIKIIINTIYGLLGNPAFASVSDFIAAADCTRLGRQWVNSARLHFKEHGYNVLYTDSVAGDSKITIKNDKNEISYINIEDLYFYPGLDKTIGNKHYRYFDNLWSLTMDDEFNIEWQPLKYVMKHYIEKDVITLDTGSQHKLTMTKDHSVITYNNKTKQLGEDSPENIDKIIINTGITAKLSNNSINHAAEMFGFWIGDGSYSGKYHINFASGIDSKEFIDKTLNHIVEFKGRNINANKKGDIKISSITVRNYMSKLGYNGTSKTKRIPKYVFGQDLEYKCSFLRGMFSADGTCFGLNGDIRYTSVNSDLIYDLKLLLESVGIGTTIIRETNENNYNGVKSGTYSKHLRITNINKRWFRDNIGFIFDRKQNKITIPVNKRNVSSKKIKTKTTMSYKGYVYDIEVGGTHRFFANDILVHNTDSVYLQDPFNDKTKLLKLRDKHIADIKRTIPFPQDTFDMSIDDEIRFMAFASKDGRLLKKNYLYVTQSGKLKMKGFTVIKSTATPLGKLVFDKFIKPEIIDNNRYKLQKSQVVQFIEDELKQDLTLASVFYKVKPPEEYNSSSQIQCQIAQKFGEGSYNIIKLKQSHPKGVGVRHNYISVADAPGLRIGMIDLSKTWGELSYFVKSEQKTLGAFFKKWIKRY